MSKHIITVDDLACVGCGACEADCPASNIKVQLMKASPVSQNCMMCGHCVAICPVGAVSISGFPEKPVDVPAGEDGPAKTSVDPDALETALRFRRSVRRFSHKDVPKEMIDRIIEAGRLTPTAVNAQGTSYFVIRKHRAELEAEAVKLVGKFLPAAKAAVPKLRGFQVGQNFFFRRAPLVIVVVSKDKVSASMAAQSMMTMAEAQGLAGFFSGFFSMAVNASGKIRSRMGIKKKDGKAVTTLVLGWPSVTYRRSAQREEARVKWL
ncbi:MAG: nitroreductase family protein [Lachnospiraceae bacterium]|nr:nitroreductase family protein [Lachnospiraceae bacterium]MBQ4308382.1 nitroreductase family protein [Lachnospiraceae bacterium]